jgi:beta-fructofuranosidase
LLRLPDHWVWDSWHAHDGAEHHIFFLRASRALLEPDRRHHRSSIGHATSSDLRRWQLQPDALVHSDPPAWDDRALWTGSVIRQPDGRWRMFYTAISHAEGRIQRIGTAVSDDLVTWTRSADNPLFEADPRWYEKYDPALWFDEAWRDPYVFRDPDGDGWHMLITARARDGSPDGRGVIGHARSPDLVTWETMPPLTAPAGFGQLEVPQSVVIDGQPVLIFSCWPDRMDATRRAGRSDGGVWIAPGESLLGPWDVDGAVALDHPSLYAGRLVQDRVGDWFVLGFRDTEHGAFVGEITDPLPVQRHGQTIRLANAAATQPGGLSASTASADRRRA